jgi:hypothetical protein
MKFDEDGRHDPGIQAKIHLEGKATSAMNGVQ